MTELMRRRRETVTSQQGDARPLFAAVARTAIVLGMLGVAVSDSQAQWPTLHRDYQRSGYSPEVVRGPYERKWWRDFHQQMIATRCEAIVAEGKVFIGTLAGKLYALDAADGSTLWTFTAAGPIGSSPCYDQRRVFFGSDDAFNRGTLYCLSAETGQLLWSYSTAGGIWASPACGGNTLYVGDRAGRLHAVRTADGSAAWTFATDYMILTPASLSPDRQKVVFGSEDMHVYCVAADGRLLWKSRKLAGLSLRDHPPTIWQGLAIVRTNPADAFHRVLDRNGEMLEAIQRSIPLDENDRVLLDRWGDLLMAPTPQRRAAELDGTVKYLEENRHDQSFFALALEDGSEPWVAPILYTAGLHNPPTPPTFHPETGQLYTLARSALTHYVRGVRRYSCLVQLDRATGLAHWFWPEREHDHWNQFPMIPDETQALSMMGELVISTHQGELSAVDPTSGEVRLLWPTRDTYAGIFGPGAAEGGFEGAQRLARQGYLTGMPNEWHGPDRGVVAVAEGCLYWIAGSQLVCIGGWATAAGDASRKPPEPFKSQLPDVTPGGNVADRGYGDVDRRRKPEAITVDQIAPYLDVPTPVSSRQGQPAADLSARLDDAVLELVRGDGGRPWAPLVVQLGISGEQAHFRRTAETIQVVSLAVPHLSQPVRAEAIAYLDRLWKSGCPWEIPLHDLDGVRREPFELGPGMRQFASTAVHDDARLFDVYAVWAYAHHADRWAPVLSAVEHVERVFDEFAGQPTGFDPHDMQHDSSQHLNRQVAGVLAAARIFGRSGDDHRHRRALELLSELVSLRVHHERTDHRLVRPTRGPRGGIHDAKIARYVDLVPELARMLGQLASGQLERHVVDLQTGLPLWYQAYGERMIGGENYISPPHLSRGLFAAWADGLEASPDELASKLDQPWCKADLYYIEKLSAALR